MTDQEYLERVAELRKSLASVELQEFLMASTSAQAAGRVSEPELRDHIVGAMRWSRISLMLWLTGNGVKIPVEFFDDRVHALLRPPASSAEGT